MSIVRLTDSEGRERICTMDDRADLEELAYQTNEGFLFSASITNIEKGVRVLVLDRSGRTRLDADCALPDNSDDMFATAGKRKFIGSVKSSMRKLIKDSPKGAA